MNRTVFPLHPAQRDVLTDQLINPESPHYNVGGYIRLAGTLHRPALLEAIESVPDVFDVFRMRFELEGEEPFCYLPDQRDGDAGYRVIGLDLSGEEDPRQYAERWMQERFDLPFAMEGDKPLFELFLLKISAHEYFFFNKYHHLVTDGYGFAVWAQYIAKKYSSLIAGRQEEFVYPAYREEAIRSDAYYRSEEYAAEARYWKNKLPEIPRKVIRPKERETGRGIKRSGKFTLLLTEAQSTTIKELEAATRSSLPHLMIAALVLYLSQLSGERELLFGVPIHKRRTRTARQIVGMLSGILPFKASYDPDIPLIGLIRGIAAAAKSDYRNQQYLLGDVNRQLKNESTEGIIDIVVNYELLDFALDFGQELQAQTFELTSNYSRFPLQIWWRDYGTQQPLELAMDFRDGYFHREEIEVLAHRLLDLLLRFQGNLQVPLGDLDVLSGKEREQLLTEFNGERIHYALDRTVVERIADQARRTPNAVAVVAGGQRLRYLELEQRSNRLGWWLRSKGVGREVLVGLYMERSVEMIVSIIGIWKAGGAYVPMDVEHPMERIQYILADTGIQLVLTSEACISGRGLPDMAQESPVAEQESPGAGRDLPRVPEWLALDREWDHLGVMLPGRPPGEPSGGDLAYVIYTSGSTGQPKGVMVEHRGLVNRLLWGQEYYGLGSEDAVLQKTTYCFDVSLWELLWPLMTGARLVFAKPGGHKDASYIKGVIESEQITVVHFVPSMLEAFLLETTPGDCRGLRRVFCSGEALKPSQAQLCKAKLPRVSLYNLYGPTEASIEVTRWAATEEQPQIVPIGKPVANTRAYILSSLGKLCPVGAPGELHLGGVQVARGYLNRPELTAEKFVRDPFGGELGNRMYRTGDLCRWMEDGNIEYLGRLDDQVKIRGYRVEPGEIEGVIGQSGMVKQAVVLAPADANGHRRLVGYIVPAPGFDREALVAYLGRQLPEYMIPVQWIELEQVPLNNSGKVDRRALSMLGTAPALDQGYVAPRTEMETVLAGIWQELLGVERIGIHDNFFERGGDSIITIQVVSRARRMGYPSIQVADLFQHPTISRLVKAVSFRADDGTSTGEQGELTGECGLLPIQRWYLEKEPVAVSHYNQGMLLGVVKGMETDVLSRVVEMLIRRHDALRFVYRREPADWHQHYDGYAAGAFAEEVWPGEKAGTVREWTNRLTDRYNRSLDLLRGELVRVVLLRTPAEEEYDRLLLVIHHLAVDGVSWRILLEELEVLVAGLRSGEAVSNGSSGHVVELGAKGSSYRQWYTALAEYGKSRRLREQEGYWQQQIQAYRPLPVDRGAAELLVRRSDTGEVRVRLDRMRTQQLLQETGRVYHTEINDLLLTALGRVLCEWSGGAEVVIGLEGHGREELGMGVELSRTVGWFTSLYPVLLGCSGAAEPGSRIKEMKERLRRVPDKGIGYGVLKYLERSPALQGRDAWDLVFNYLGQIDQLGQTDQPGQTDPQRKNWWIPLEESPGELVSERYESQERIVVNSIIRGGELELSWAYSRRHYEEGTIAKLAGAYLRELEGLIAHCVEQVAGGVQATPSDYGLGRDLDHTELDAFLKEGMLAGRRGYVRRSEVMDGMCRLSALQEGMLFHGMYEKTEAYVEQFSCTIKGLNEDAFRRSWQEIMRRHSILRSAFYYDVFRIPVQCVYREVELPIEVIDWWGRDADEQQRMIAAYADEQRRQGFEFREAPLMRIGLFRLDADHYRMIWTYHHLLLDGWSLPVLIGELLEVYAAFAAGEAPAVVEDDRFEEYIRHIEASEKERESIYWRQYLSGLEGGVLLPFIDGAERNKGIGEYAEETLWLGEAETLLLQRYAQRHGITVNTVMQGIWAYLIYRYTGSRHVVYGVTVSGRPEQLSGIEKRVGLYINTLPLYTVVNEAQVLADWLRSMQQDQSGSRQYQHTALPDIQRWLGVSGDLFDSLLVFENYPVSEVLASQKILELSEISMRENSNYPLSVTITGWEETVVRWSYNTRAVGREYVEQLRDAFAQLLLQISSSGETLLVGELQSLPAQERKKLLEWSGLSDSRRTGEIEKEGSWLDRWDRQMAGTPDAPAIICGDSRMSYREVDLVTDRLAGYFRGEVGLKKGERVVVGTDRSEWILLLMLSVMKSGLVYVPVDAEYPEERIRFILEDVRPALVITENEVLPALRAWVAAGNGVASFEREVGPEDEAYIIYTSGSTGTPKGVMVRHGALDHFLQAVCANFTAADALTMPFIASHAFDISLFQLLTPILSGGASVIVAREELQEMEGLAKIISQVSALDTVPALFNLIVNHLATHPARPDCDHIKRIFIGGDVIQDELLQRLRSVFRKAVITVTYGPTEGTIFCAFTEYAPGDDQREPKGSVIGRPLGRGALYLVDDKLNLVPAGAPGEICIGGPGVAKGYWHKRELTAEKFVGDPYAADLYAKDPHAADSSATDARLYRTGDVGSWTREGLIRFMGRRDDQVKIRGFRVEPGEIEAVLLGNEAVSRAVVLAKQEADNNKRLIAFVVPVGRLDKDKLFAHLRSRLPEYMIPFHIVGLAAIPLTGNAKIDKAALLQMADKDLAEKEYTAPRTELERQLAAIWRSLLGIERIGIADNFFALGGHSILVTRLASAIRKELGVRIAIRSLFQLTTIEAMARFIMIHRRQVAPVDLEEYQAVKI